MIEKLEKNKCTGCGACACICGENCINMSSDNEGFLYPEINKTKCISCDLCEKVCPLISLSKIAELNKVYSVYAKDNTIRRKSSSGGVFYLLAENIIKNNGVVFGAALNEELIVEHICVTNINDLRKLQMAKYVQSAVKDAYKLVQKYLNEGKQVLFTGTPCQVAGLKGYLRKDYNNLFTQDLICNGVPSPMLWESHKEYLTNSEGLVLTNVEFRNKAKGWRNYDVNYIGKNKSVMINHDDDFYMKIYFSKICLRPSCYNCAFKGENRFSDITLGDFWGIENIKPEMDDNMGTSAVICNTVKGMDFFTRIADMITYKEVNINDVIASNPMYIESVSKCFREDKFYRILRKRSYKKAVSYFIDKQNRQNIIIELKNDYYTIKKEKGLFYAMIWAVINFAKN